MADDAGAGADEYLVCRALYDYTSEDGSALSTLAGGTVSCRGERGWFPSNYVRLLTEAEADALFSDSDVEGGNNATGEQASLTASDNTGTSVTQATSNGHDSEVVDMSSAMMGSLASDSDWMPDDLSSSSLVTFFHDFWIPEVTNDGQGQRSRDLPSEDNSDHTDLAGLTTQPSSRSGTSAGLGYASDSSASDGEGAGFGLPRTTGTPEPWVRRLADDGYAYYYFNKITQEVQWTRPDPAIGTTKSGTPIPAAVPSFNRSSVYSDSSDIQPFDSVGPRQNGVSQWSPPPASAEQTSPAAAAQQRAPVRPSRQSEISAAERIAHSLQKTLQPPEQDSVTDLSALARNAIQSIVNNVHSPNRRAEEMDNLISAVVDCVRNLLYVSAAPTGQIPPAVLPREARDSKLPSSSSPLKPGPTQVLSARAMRYDAGSQISETLNRIEVDAEELERAIMSFVLEVQRLQHATPTGPTQRTLKRLHGVFSVNNIGLGLVGAGAAGAWSGFGFVPVDDTSTPQRNLGPEVVQELAAYLQQLDGHFSTLGKFIGSTSIASADHVDPDGIQQERSVADDLRSAYSQTVDRVRLLIRTLEAAIQSLYNEGTSFFLNLQSLREIELGQSLRDRDSSYDQIDILSTSLKSNMAIVQQTLETLMHTGHEQAEIAQGEYHGAIENRRNSRLSALRPNSAIYIPEEYGGNGMNGGDYSEQSASEQEVEDEDSDEDFFDERPNEENPSKMEQILGERVQNLPKPQPPAEPVPWFLKADYNPTEILVDPDFSVRGGTVPALVARLTAHEHQDSNYLAFQRSFLMTFKSFTTVDELFDLLVARFWIEPPPNLAPADQEKWANLKQRVIQARVLNTLKVTYLPVLNRIKDFIQKDEVVGVPPPPIMPKLNRKLKLLDIDPLEMARQLTIMESRLYQRIKPMECLQRAREQKTESMDNIAIVIQTSNRIADWVAESILTKEDSRKRAAAVKHLISIADRCRTMNNFSTMIAITSGLNTPPIRRLKRTWEQVNQKVMAMFTACEMTIDSSKNFAKYRQLMATITPPCVPFIGVFLTTLQFIQDGNKDNLPGDLVNFKKRQKASEVISDIQRWQQQSFNFQPIPSIQSFLEDSLNQFQDTKASSEHFWTLSLEREPREREDEKMARLLQESGFL
ncbi:ras GEF [Flagelloscypha sp. PMI_526]|nr:ras GEF [Flagelloscypha sp. PMI_526]